MTDVNTLVIYYTTYREAGALQSEFSDTLPRLLDRGACRRAIKLNRRAAVCVLSFLISSPTIYGCNTAQEQKDNRFTIAVIPDTQNMLKYTHQKAEGFPLDAVDVFYEQMRFVAENSVTRGGDIVFAASVGDVWYHIGNCLAEDHRLLGLDYAPGERLFKYFHDDDYVEAQFEDVELPAALKGYDILAASGLPFGVAPGNHDYDCVWYDSRFPPDHDRLVDMGNVDFSSPDFQYDKTVLGLAHFGGVTRFNRAFGEDSEYFREKEWYVASHNGGANSAQVFSAGGYEFLHITVELLPGNEVLKWAERVMVEYPGIPTIVTAHSFIDSQGARASGRESLDGVHPDQGAHNTAEDLWQKLVSRHDQVFLVLSGHYSTRAFREDKNANGNAVYQIMSNYQVRSQVAKDAGYELRKHHDVAHPTGHIGDGWLRLMEFDFTCETPEVRIKTYSTYYDSYSIDLETYVDWYKESELPELSDEQYLKTDDFIFALDDFKERFGAPS